MSIRIGLRQLIESIILEEGFKDDLRYLVENFPDHAADLESLGSKPKWIVWLAARFGENPSKKETHPFEDAIVTVKNFSKKDAAIGEKYRANAQFKMSIDEAFPLDKRSWNTPSDITTMSVDDMETVLALSERKKQRIEVNVSEEDMESDRVGKVGLWNLWMPTTRERSCKIAQYDPITKKPKTTWCTARMAGSNLFYNYVGRPGADTTLFYIIKDEPEELSDWLSVGFVNGKPVLEGQEGGISVDRDNTGLTSTRLKDILGSDYEQIMNKLGEKNKSLGGKHPARAKIDDAAKSLEGLEYLIRGVSAEESTDLKKMVLESSEVSPEVLAVLAIDKVVEVRKAVASHESVTPKILAALASDSEAEVRMIVAQSKKTPPEALRALSKDSEQYVQNELAFNENAPPDILATFADHPDKKVRHSLALNKNVPKEVLIVLAKDSEAEVRRSVARKSSTPREVLKALAEDPEIEIRKAVAGNKNTPIEVLEVLASDPAGPVRYAVEANENTPIEVLNFLLGDKNSIIAKKAKSNLRQREALGESRLLHLIESIIQDDQPYLTENLSNQSRGTGKPSGNVSESLVRGLVREILSEDAYKKRTGKRFTDDVDKIRNNLDKEGYFLHFSDVPKIGINPKSRYLPGVYFYPNIKEIYDGFVKNVVGTYRGAGRASRYVFLVRLKDGLNIVEGDQIKERAHETLRSISKPLLDLDIDDSSRVGREKDFKQEVFHRLEGISSNMADPQLKSIDQIDSKLLEKVYKNYSDLGEIYKDFINRPRMSEKQKEEFIKKINGRLAEYRKRFGPTAAGVAPTLEGLDSKSVEKFNIRMKTALSPAKISPNGELSLTDADIDKELKDLSREYQIRYSETGPSISGITRAAVLQATIALNGSSAMVKSFVEYFAEPVQDIKNTTKFLRWLLDKNDLQLQLRSGDTASLADLKAQCVKRLEETMGNNYTRLMKAVNDPDLVGVNILLVMGSGIVDGINDTGRKKSDIVWGHGGILGKYEGAQLFLSAPVTNKFEIVTMIDRYEGKPESWEPPGLATPDREAGSTSEFAVNPREPSLKARLVAPPRLARPSKKPKDSGEKQEMIPSGPRARWADVK